MLFRGIYYVSKAKMCGLDGVGVGRKRFIASTGGFIYQKLPKKSSRGVFFSVSRSRIESGVISLLLNIQVDQILAGVF